MGEYNGLESGEFKFQFSKRVFELVNLVNRQHEEAIEEITQHNVLNKNNS